MWYSLVCRRKRKPVVYQQWMLKTHDRSYNALEKEKSFSFGNDTPAFIKGKGSVFLKEKVKAGNVMYVDGLKHNLLSVSQMCDQGNVVF